MTIKTKTLDKFAVEGRPIKLLLSLMAASGRLRLLMSNSCYCLNVPRRLPAYAWSKSFNEIANFVVIHY